MVNGHLVPAHGIVKYAKPASAQAAMTYLQGYLYSGQSLLLSWAPQGPSFGPSPTLPPETSAITRSDTCLYSVFVGDLCLDINDGALAQAFSRFPSLYDARVIRDPKTQTSRGFGFVRFRNEADAMESIAVMTGQWLRGRIIRVNWAVRPAEPMPQRTEEQALPLTLSSHEQTSDTTTLYVGNLHPDTTLQDIMPVFSPYGNVINAQMFPGRHYAFITFQFSSNAKQALKAMLKNPPILSGTAIKVGPARYTSRHSSSRR
ncbi:E3 ubiquitin-protein ligase pub1 [Malassezia nana]|uniref:E3 ubiquitin-protein ligase pub1 n=1 Tax=Malassezia nana TaxID=180528 RepID=A0AAF0EI07_9BASI|nr:E3 ubiquitin-protein ligase pub1 [Malassezia nana]